VVGSATDPYAAREKIKKLNPDVLTLDVEMPRMDGLTFLSNLMRLRPMPVVMVSSLTEAGAAVTLQALELGAVDFVTKPKVDLAHTLDDYALEIREKVRMAAGARVQERTPHSEPRRRHRPVVSEKYSADVILRQRRPAAAVQDHGKHYRDRRVHRRHRGDQGSADPHAAGLSRHRDHPAHSGSVQRPVRPADGFGGGDFGVRGAGRPASVFRATPTLRPATGI
jgi:CheY-like chemotaxis protein